MISLEKNKLGKLVLSKADLSLFGLIKARKNWGCFKCGKEIKKGFYCFGGSYGIKICLKCIEGVFNNYSSSLDEEKLRIKKLQEDLSANKERYEKNNLVCGLA